MEVEHHLVLKMSDVLNWITRSGVAVKGGSQEFPRKFIFLDIFGKRGVVEVDGRDQVLRQFGLHVYFWINSSRDGDSGTPVLGVTF